MRKQKGMKIAFWIFTRIAAFNILWRLGLLYQDLAYLYGEAAITVEAMALGGLVIFVLNPAVWMAAVLGIIILVRQNNDRKGVVPPPVQPIKWGPGTTQKKGDPIQPIKWGPSKKADVPDPEWLPPNPLTAYQPGKAENGSTGRSKASAPSRLGSSRTWR